MQDQRLDHVVLLVPYDTLSNPPAWITDNFHLSPGGRHGDNKTENRLVLFRDGTYLELIAFINDDPEKRQGHWWDKPFGIVDFAFTPKEPLDYDALVSRLEKSGTGITYAEPKQGGRSTGGHDIKWRVTFPIAKLRGNVPFFCEDITTRQWRVPISEENTTHPCGALGMAGVLLEINEKQFDKLSIANAAVLNVARDSKEEYKIGVPNEVEGLKNPSIRLQRASADSEHELALTLLLQTGGKASHDPIREKIGDGLIKIDFE